MTKHWSCDHDAHNVKTTRLRAILGYHDLNDAARHLGVSRDTVKNFLGRLRVNHQNPNIRTLLIQKYLKENDHEHQER